MIRSYGSSRAISRAGVGFICKESGQRTRVSLRVQNYVTTSSRRYPASQVHPMVAPHICPIRTVSIRTQSAKSKLAASVGRLLCMQASRSIHGSRSRCRSRASRTELADFGKKYRRYPHPASASEGRHRRLGHQISVPAHSRPHNVLTGSRRREQPQCRQRWIR